MRYLSIVSLVWLYYRYRVNNGKNIVALERARYEIVKEIFKFTTGKIEMSGKRIVIGDKTIIVQDNPGGGAESPNLVESNVTISASGENEITFKDSALSSVCEFPVEKE